jgi:hypothetical protein
MRRLAGLALAWTLVIAGSPGVLAQQPAYSVQRPGVPQPPALPSTSAPSFSILGIPTVIKAPVARPYCNCATQSYGGQAMRSGDILFGPEPDRAQ